jgi:hypothetical protein
MGSLDELLLSAEGGHVTKPGVSHGMDRQALSAPLMRRGGPLSYQGPANVGSGGSGDLSSHPKGAVS